MTLFDFLKKKEKVEKNEARKKTRISDSRPEKEEIQTQTKKNVVAPAVLNISVGRFALIAPHVTERARMLSEDGQYTFRVHPKSTKREIKSAVEKTYSVHVEHVQVVKVHEKPRRRGLTEGVKKGYKKAVVALRQGEAIDIF
ncbi:MAG: 50S ribosomal protein L23 [Patescibacteria group bacterium]